MPDMMQVQPFDVLLNWILRELEEEDRETFYNHLEGIKYLANRQKTKVRGDISDLDKIISHCDKLLDMLNYERL